MECGLTIPGLISLSGSQVFKVGRMLQMLADVGDKLPDAFQTPTIFDLESRPRASILVYFLQLASTAGLQDEQSILVLILIERLCHFNETLTTAVNINTKSIYK